MSSQTRTPQPAATQQLPHLRYYFPGSASLADQLDKRVLVILRDGKKLIGSLCSFDQFANLVLESTVERIVVKDLFADLPLGLYIVRGENVLLMAEIDENKELLLTNTKMLKEVPLEVILEMQKKEKEQKEAQQQVQRAMMKQNGLSFDETESFL